MRLAVRLLAALAALSLPAFSAAAPAQAEKRVALVIGNATYVHVPRLVNSANDAKLMAETLRGLGFALVGGGAQLDLDKPGFDRAVQAFGEQLQGAEVALFYYAGHGVQVRGANYLVPVGANPVKEADVDFQMLDANLVLRQMEGAGTRLNLLVLDACRNNPFGGRGLRSAGSGLAQMQAPEGTLISFATQPGNVALDGAGANSPFTSALAGVIRRPGLDIFRTFNEVGLAVKQATGGAQQPWVSSSPIAGSFYFAGHATGSDTQPDGNPSEVAALQERLKALEEQLKSQLAKPRDETKVAVGTYPDTTESALARSYKPGDTFKDCDDCPDMVVVPAGSFMMGSPKSEKGREDVEGPQHKVTIARPFAVGKFEVTRGQFEAFVRDTNHTAAEECFIRVGKEWEARSGQPWRNPGFSQGADHPAACIAWDDAAAYVAWLARKTGKEYRLLSEAEWEYAARAGTTTPFFTGSKIEIYQANFDAKQTYNGSTKADATWGKTLPVGEFDANAFGLHDMHGNLTEWVEDCWNYDNRGYAGAPTDGSAWKSGDCAHRAARGGSWLHPPSSLRSAHRTAHSGGLSTFGFRVALTLTP